MNIVVCTIVGEMVLGVRSEPCGRVATHISVGRCERGHTRARPVCTHHAEAFRRQPDAIFCEQCDECGAQTIIRTALAPITLDVGGEVAIVQFEDLPDEVQERAVNLAMIGDHDAMMSLIRRAVDQVQAPAVTADPYATWDPSQATDDPDGLPDRAIVPLVEDLRGRGVVTLQSCAGHAGRQDGHLWVRADTVALESVHQLIVAAAADSLFHRVALMYGPEPTPVWEFVWPPQHTERAIAALGTLTHQAGAA